MSVLAAFVHHLAFLLLAAMLTVQLVLLRGQLDVGRAKQLVAVDAVLGVSATLLAVAGLSRLFLFEKGATYYFHSVPFVTKLVLFVFAAVISFVPTRRLMAWRPALKRNELPVISEGEVRTMRRLIHWELVAVALILLCAVLAAKGYGIVSPG